MYKTLVIGLLRAFFMFLYRSLFPSKQDRDFGRPDYDMRKLLVFILLVVSLLFNALTLDVAYNLLKDRLVYETVCGDIETVRSKQ